MKTPLLELTHGPAANLLPKGAQVWMKLELFQQAGSFKTRGVLLAIDAMSSAERRAGVIAASGGNHAFAVATACAREGIDALIVMPEAADARTVARCDDLGATIRRTPGARTDLALLDQLAQETGRTKLHPFDTPHMILGAATCGYEITNNLPELDAMIVPVGGGGLIAGISRTFKQFCPMTQIIGVEPEGAASMTRSLEAGQPLQLDTVDTCAVSLAASRAEPLTFAAAAEHVDRMVTLADGTMIDAMRALSDSLGLMVEPACAASFAALTGPLAAEMAGKKVGIIACGSNLSRAGYARIIGEG
ncbi:threonine/serine dehydratase [Roseobacter sp. HKCCA0434]|uniref:threonine ammonia-lyase n=1 Tax=Roseobacter sp. HKCCA0434 TaxID=3079297 RepID=UPI002905CC77|nr:threonine/serine dehydratase [Roseobacter sp. HKCCA0434]